MPRPSLSRVFGILEGHYRDMCDIEFTIEQGKLWILQTRAGKRTAAAALRIAIDMVEEGLISRDEALMRIDPSQLDQLLHPQFDTSAAVDVLARGLNAEPRSRRGRGLSFPPTTPLPFMKPGAPQSSCAGRRTPMTSRACRR